MWQSRAENLVPCHWIAAPKDNSIVVGSEIRYDFHDFHGVRGQHQAIPGGSVGLSAEV